MWLRLGDSELVNLDHARFIRKGPDFSIEIHMESPDQRRIIPFPNEEACNRTFEKLVENLVKARQAMK